MLLQNCFIFREIYEKDSDTYSGIQVSDNFNATLTKLGMNLQNSNGKTGFKRKNK